MSFCMYQGAASWVDRDPGLPVPVPAGTSHEALKIQGYKGAYSVLSGDPNGMCLSC